MRVLFYHTATEWTGSARVFDAAARGLVARRWEVTFACLGGSPVEARASRGGYDVVPVWLGRGWIPESWRLREVLLERFIEVIFVHTEREQRVAALALRLAERGAVVRRLRAGERVTFRMGARLAARMAATGVVLSSAIDREAAPRLPPRSLEPVVAQLGVDARRHDETRAITASALGAPPSTRLLACVYDPSGKPRAATVLRTLALLKPRHPELRLAIVGAGADHEDLRMHAAALGITSVVSHLGVREDHLSVLRAAELGWVVAEHDEAAFGYLDLMALRVPVLAPRTPLAQHYVADGIAGSLLAAEDAPATAARVASILAHDEQRLAMGNAGHLRALREFPESEMIDGFERAASAARDRVRWRR